MTLGTEQHQVIDVVQGDLVSFRICPCTRSLWAESTDMSEVSKVSSRLCDMMDKKVVITAIKLASPASGSDKTELGRFLDGA